MTAQKPSVGRIVLAIVDPATNNGADVAPAVITRVWNDEIVNVRVLLDGAETPWKTSVSLHEDRESLDAAMAKLRGGLAPVGYTGNFTAHAVYWPPRV